MRREFVNE